MFSTRNAIITGGNSYMNPGINENATLSEVNVNTTAQGRKFLEIIFADENGGTAKMTEWKNEKNQWIKTDDDLQKRNNLQFGRILQILFCFYDTVEDVELNSFDEMINWVKSKLDPMISTKKPLRIKAAYDNRGYVQISTNGIFVESMEISKDNSRIVLMGRDKMTRPEFKVDVEPSTDPFANDSTSENENNGTPADDLPF